MNFTSEKLTVDKLDSVDALMKTNSSTLGFLPRAALKHYFTKEGVLGITCGKDELVGYLLFAINSERVRIAQLCVSDEFRGKGLAKSLIDTLVGLTTTQTEITLHCRRDYQVNRMWPKFGFKPIGERPGRAREGSVLTYWRRTLRPDSQLSLFQAQTQDETVDVIIDSQIFIDLSNPDSADNQTYKTLNSDSSILPTKFWITDELYSEIDRITDDKKRNLARQNADLYPPVVYEPKTAECYEEILKDFLPSNKASEVSDINHLALAAASNVSIFITRDNGLLKKSDQIKSTTNLDVLNPTNLIIRLHESSNKDSYTTYPISGLSLLWCRLTNENFPPNLYEHFLLKGERLHQFKEKLEFFLANPIRYRCLLLSSNNEVVAIRVDETESDSTLITHFCRVWQRRTTGPLFIGYLVTSTLYDAINRKCCLVKFTADSMFPRLVPNLLDRGFVKCNENYVRFCIASSLKSDQILEKIESLDPEVVGKYSGMTDSELEQFCSPLNNLTNQQPKILIPIRREYAISLINCDLATEDLFGGNVHVLLRWANVYYRKKSHHNLLKSSVRILWYVSGGRYETGKIMATSRLDEIEIGTPKDLYKKFRHDGILDWKEIYTMCEEVVDKEIMVLKFSHTFPFRNPVDLKSINEVYENTTGRNPILWSPAKLDFEIFNKLFELGYSN